MKIAKIIFSILTILSVIAVAVVALMYENDTLTDFWQTVGIMIVFGVLAMACMAGIKITDDAIDIAESYRELEKYIEE